MGGLVMLVRCRFALLQRIPRSVRVLVEVQNEVLVTAQPRSVSAVLFGKDRPVMCRSARQLEAGHYAMAKASASVLVLAQMRSVHANARHLGTVKDVRKRTVSRATGELGANALSRVAVAFSSALGL
jgi:hypothetical protein